VRSPPWAEWAMPGILGRSLLPCWLMAVFLGVTGAGIQTASAIAASGQSQGEAADYCRGSRGARLEATPTNYRDKLTQLTPGYTLILWAGNYPRLVLRGLNGQQGSCITVTGPASGPPAIIQGELGSSTVEIVNSSYLVVRDLTIDSRGMLGADGIKAGGADNVSHHIIVQGNRITGAGASQQTDGISTKITTWNWIIRGNWIEHAGTGMYLGNSDGSAPFIAGLIGGNRVIDPIGYCIQVKYQIARPLIPDVPEPATTVIRRNVLVKSDRPSPDGNRPNLLVGGFPNSGACSADLYQIYQNLIVHNSREVLFQGSGRITLHDNILVGGVPAAAVFCDHDLPLKFAHVYNNTIYAERSGIAFRDTAVEEDAVTGNLVFAETPITGPIGNQQDNFVARIAEAGRYVKSPSTSISSMDFFPLRGAAKGSPFNLDAFRGERDFDRDFEGNPKRPGQFRGAYAKDVGKPALSLRARVEAKLPLP
jgi:hypothetical protein